MTLVAHDDARAALHTRYAVVHLLPPERCVHCGTMVEPGTHPVAHTPPGHAALAGRPRTVSFKCALCGRLAGSPSQPICGPDCGIQDDDRHNRVPYVVEHPDGHFEIAAEHCDPCERTGICGLHNEQAGGGAACVPLED